MSCIEPHIEVGGLGSSGWIHLKQKSCPFTGNPPIGSVGIESDAEWTCSASEGESLNNCQCGWADDADGAAFNIGDPDTTVGCNGESARCGAHVDLGGSRPSNGIEDCHAVIVRIHAPDAIIRASRSVFEGNAAGGSRAQGRQRRMDALVECGGRDATRIIGGGDRDLVAARGSEGVCGSRIAAEGHVGSAVAPAPLVSHIGASGAARSVV